MSLTLEQAFQILEVPPTATWDEVRQAYREMVKVWHPDRFHDDAKFQARATKKAQDINAAYQILEQHFQSPPPASSQKADEMFEQWTKDSQRPTAQATPTPADHFPNFATLDDLVKYFSLGLQYHVYPCRIERSNNKELNPERMVRYAIFAVVVVGALTWLFGLPNNLLIVTATIAGTLMAVEWLCGKLAIPDALILTEIGVTMVEGIRSVGSQYTATTCHTFLYEHLREVKWNEEEISFRTVTGLRFSFRPTRKEALTVPDTNCFKVNVYSTAHVIARFQNRK
jgi:hypothetical protein